MHKCYIDNTIIYNLLLILLFIPIWYVNIAITFNCDVVATEGYFSIKFCYNTKRNLFNPVYYVSKSFTSHME
jgi:hypothetical protein